MPLDLLFALELGPVKVTMVTAAIGAFVSFIVGALLVWLQSVGRKRVSTWWATRQDKRYADHTTIAGGWYFGDLTGASAEYLVCLRAAPSKRLSVPVRLDVGRIAPFVRKAFGDLFPGEPEVSNPAEVVRYRRKDTGHPGIDQFVVVWPSGLIEALVPLASSSNDAGEPVVDLVGLAQAVMPAIRVIQESYEQIFGAGAELPLGLDWEFKLSRELVGTTPTPWVDLVFPGRVPAGRATNRRPPWPQPGFGREQLRGVRTTTAPVDVLFPALKDLVERAEYHSPEDALADLRAAISRLSLDATSTDTAQRGPS